MPIKRPGLAYFLMLNVALLAWVSFSFVNLIPALLILIAVIVSYKLNLPLWNTAPWQNVMFFIVFATFAYFLLYSSYQDRYISIYSEQLIHALAFALAMMIALQWYLETTAQFDWLMFSLGMLLLVSGVAWQTQHHKMLYLWLVLSFTMIVLAFMLSRFKLPLTYDKKSQRVYWFALLQSFLIFIALGYFNIQAMEYADRQFNELMQEYMLNNNTNWSGFSGFTQLKGNQEIRLSERVAFTVKSPQALDYWRGNILTHYEKGQWYPKEVLHVPAQRESQNENKHIVLYPKAIRPGALKEAQVSMQDHYQGILFLPPQSREVILPPKTVSYQNQYQLLRRELKEVQHEFRILYSEGPIPAYFDHQTLQDNLSIQPQIKAQLQALAKSIVKDAKTPLEKAKKIENWFQKNFEYSLKTQSVPKDQDPTIDFILNRRPAWCSWFASGMTLMLRSLDIPAHLVSGWRSMDYNPLLQRWIVKEKEAHDWVEVLDTDHHLWVQFDPTPPAGIAELTGSGANPSWLEQLSDSLRLGTSLLQERLQTMGPGSLLANLQALALSCLKSIYFYLVLFLLLLLNLGLKRRKKVQDKLNFLDYQPSQWAHQNHARLNRWAQKNKLILPFTPYSEWLQELPEENHAQLLPLLTQLQVQRYGQPSDQTNPELQKTINQGLFQLESKQDLGPDRR